MRPPGPPVAGAPAALAGGADRAPERLHVERGDPQAAGALERLGGHVAGSVSRRTDDRVVGQAPGRNVALLYARGRSVPRTPARGDGRVGEEVTANLRTIARSPAKTINLAEEASPDTVAAISREAWRVGLKGITVYRDGFEARRVLTLGLEEEPTTREFFTTCGPGAGRL